MLTLRLFHGRRSPDEHLSDWGRDGPVLGPLKSVSSTYCSELRVETTDEDVVYLHELAGLIYYGGVFYGDFEISNQLEATEQANANAAEVESLAFRKATSNLLESERRLRGSGRLVAMLAVFLDSVRATEGDTSAELLREYLARKIS
jgi:hypothetical protein